MAAARALLAAAVRSTANGMITLRPSLQHSAVRWAATRAPQTSPARQTTSSPPRGSVTEGGASAHGTAAQNPFLQVDPASLTPEALRARVAASRAAATMEEDSEGEEASNRTHEAESQPWRPKKRLSRHQMEHMRALHQSDGTTFSIANLANLFGVSNEAARRILRSKWQPSDAIVARQDARARGGRAPRKTAASRGDTLAGPGPRA
eukprot:m.226323 g.226323  ORF g.226323 m.226323 type:complete len:207 (+) comp11410_c0_seq1:3955-4575(+)